MSNKAIVHIRQPPIEPRSYSLWQRAKAFFRGFKRQGPLVEVAFEGFSGRYALSPKLKERYAQRLRASKERKGVSARIVEMMKNGCSEQAQELFAGMWASEFKLALDSLQNVSRPSDTASLIAALRSGGTSHATELTMLRRMAAESILSGNVTHMPAQLAMAPILRHYKILDPIFVSHSKILHSFLPQLLESGHTVPRLRAYLIESIRQSGCLECEQDLGNVVNMLSAADSLADMSDECA